MKRQFKIIVLFAFLIFSNSNAQSNSKTFAINWPKEEGWHIVNQQNNAEGSVTMIVSLKGKETIENHSEIVTTYIGRGSMNVPIETKLKELLHPLKNAPIAIKTIIEKDEKAEYPWFICKIEYAKESQLWYVIKGKNELYASFWGTYQNEITPESQEKLVKIFKSSKIISE
ncbi:hypothetical protein [Flavobacterium aestivum]|uniref:hypothetical protein n=1 Tax=Flavobacterium aestivum TaxID=3003257 RepID=UPI002482F9B9|nr:hypothetical protein [Flavobacterium aestivum]